VIAFIVTSLFLSAVRAALYIRRHPEEREVDRWTRVWRWTRPVVFTICGLVSTLAIFGYILSVFSGTPVER
jgi:hypothetical protein